MNNKLERNSQCMHIRIKEKKCLGNFIFFWIEYRFGGEWDIGVIFHFGNMLNFDISIRNLRHKCHFNWEEIGWNRRWATEFHCTSWTRCIDYGNVPLQTALPLIVMVIAFTVDHSWLTTMPRKTNKRNQS